MSRFKHHEIILEDLKNIEDLLRINIAKSKEYYNTYNDYDLALEEYIEELLIKQRELAEEYIEELLIKQRELTDLENGYSTIVTSESIVDLIEGFKEPKKTIRHLRLVKD